MVKAIIGLDLGDGDTNVANRPLQDGSPADRVQDIQLPNTPQAGFPLPTIIATSDVGDVIGYGVLDGNFKDLHVNFKKRPSTLSKEELDDYGDVVKRYVKALFSDTNFFNRCFVAPSGHFVDEAEILIGYPTTWEELDRDLYRNFFDQSNLVDQCKQNGINLSIRLEKESRAAILSALQNNPEIKQRIQRGRGILAVVDFGSSTTDVTIISKPQTGTYRLESVDLGDGGLGARVIDQNLFKITKRKKGLIKGQLINKESQYILQCRKAKEVFFSTAPQMREQYDSPYYADDPNSVYKWAIASGMPNMADFRLGDYFHSSWITEALEAPSDYLNGSSYKEASRRLLEKVANFLKNSNAENGVLLLTGGASRMDFLKEYAEEILQTEGTTSIEVLVDPHPEVAVSRGLGAVTIAEEKAKEFLDAVEKMCRDNLGTILKNDIKGLTESIAQTLVPEIIGITRQQMLLWRSGSYRSLDDMEEAIKDKIEIHVKSPACKEGVGIAVNKWLGKVLGGDINNQMREVCRDNNIPYDNQLKTIGAVLAQPNADISGVGQVAAKSLQGQVSLIILRLLTPIMAVVTMLSAAIAVKICIIIGTLIVTICAGNILLWGPAAIVAGLGAIYAIRYGWQAIANKFKSVVKSANLPNIIRTSVTDAHIQQTMTNLTPEIRNQIREEVEKSEDFREAFNNDLTQNVKKIVLALANEITFVLT